MAKSVSVIIPDNILEAIDREVMRRKTAFVSAKRATNKELEEALQIAEKSGTIDANAYLKERNKVRTAAAKGLIKATSRHGLALEFILQGAASLPKSTPKPDKKKRVIKLEEAPAQAS